MVPDRRFRRGVCVLAGVASIIRLARGRGSAALACSCRPGRRWQGFRSTDPRLQPHQGSTPPSTVASSLPGTDRHMPASPADAFCRHV